MGLTTERQSGSGYGKQFGNRRLIAKTLAREGATVIVHGRNADRQNESPMRSASRAAKPLQSSATYQKKRAQKR